MTKDLKSPIPPGGSAALPEGTLPKPFFGPQGDENRDPPPNAPAPVNPTATLPNPDHDAGNASSSRPRDKA
jgi:hypothetical protein